MKQRPWVRGGLGAALGVLSILLPMAGAEAAVLSITNPGFETDAVGDGIVSIVTPTGWSVYNPANIDGSADSVGVLNPTGTTHYPGGAPEGSRVALVFMGGAATGEAGLQQTLGSVLEAGLQYTLTVGVGNIASGTANFGFFDLDGFPGYRVDLLAGGSVLASDNNTLSGSIPEGEFRTSTVNFTSLPGHAALGTPLSIRLVNLNIPGTVGEPGIEVNFDNVQLSTSAVPEPESVALTTGAALLGLWSMRHRRRAPGVRAGSGIP